jgi:RNA polymerase sigma-70 factor (ECF subfamily)
MLWTFAKHLAARIRARISGRPKIIACETKVGRSLARLLWFANDNDQIDRIALIDPYHGTSEGRASDRRLAMVRRAIEHLPDRSRSVFLMSRVDGLTFAEIARELGISRRAVRRAMLIAVVAIDRAFREP